MGRGFNADAQLNECGIFNGESLKFGGKKSRFVHWHGGGKQLRFSRPAMTFTL